MNVMKMFSQFDTKLNDLRTRQLVLEVWGIKSPILWVSGFNKYQTLPLVYLHFHWFALYVWVSVEFVLAGFVFFKRQD